MTDAARILVTGATGSFGRHLARELARRDNELVLLVRADSDEEADARARVALGEAFHHRRIVALQADLGRLGLGLRAHDRRALETSVDVIVHAAATTTFSLPLEIARRGNVGATRNVLAFAIRAPRLSRVGFVGTAFVAGRRTGRILESELLHGAGFLNSYQQSKYEAEELIRRHDHLLPVVVLRPSVVIDDERQAGGPGRSAVRLALQLIRRGLLPALPGRPDTLVDLITATDAARASATLLARASAGDVYHVAAGESSPTLAEIVGPLSDVRFLREDAFRAELNALQLRNSRLAAVYRELSSFIYELAHPKVFDTTRARSRLGRPVQARDPLDVLLVPPSQGRERAYAA